jgi:hypothetical protein
MAASSRTKVLATAIVVSSGLLISSGAYLFFTEREAEIPAPPSGLPQVVSAESIPAHFLRAAASPATREAGLQRRSGTTVAVQTTPPATTISSDRRLPAKAIISPVAQAGPPATRPQRSVGTSNDPVGGSSADPLASALPDVVGDLDFSNQPSASGGPLSTRAAVAGFTPAASAATVTEPAAQIPAIFVEPDPATPLTAVQSGEWQQLEKEFTAELKVAPSDPSYSGHWRSAQEISDEKFRQKFGTQAFLEYQLAAFLTGASQ